MGKKPNEKDFQFYCFTCKKFPEFKTMRSVYECETPVGKVNTPGYKAYCKECGEEVTCRGFKDMNYMLITADTIQEWRKQNSDGTKKQCHFRLGLRKEVVDFLWDKSSKTLEDSLSTSLLQTLNTSHSSEP